MRIIKRSHLILLFCLVSAIQIWVPLSMIARREATLNKGTAYKFRTRPVDPYDAFRGRYVALSFESDLAIATNVNRFTRGETVYVAVEVATNGYAKLGIATYLRPHDVDYIRTKVNGWRSVSNTVRVELPFDRFYMNEELAPEAEVQFRRTNQREQRKAYALVRIRSGMAVIEDLYIEDRPILEFLESGQK